MTTIIIILTIIAAILMFIWLGIKAYNRPKVEKQITERRNKWFDFREKRFYKIFKRRKRE